MKKIVGVFMLAGMMTLGGAFSATAPHVLAEEKAVVNVGNKICPISGREIGVNSGMASATYEYKGKLYSFCCPGCISKFKADPEKYSKIAQDEVAAQQAK